MIEELLQYIGTVFQRSQDVPQTAVDLSLADFVRWKPLAERLAMAQQPQAEPVAAAITEVAERVGDQACMALAHWIHANVLYLLDQPAAAIPHYDAAEANYALQGEALQIARLRIGKIGALAQLGQYDAALEQGQAAAAILTTSSIETDQNRLAALHDQIGVVSEFLGRYLESLDGYQQKYKHWQARLNALNALDADKENAEAKIEAEIELARASANIGVAKTRLGQFVEASAAFQSARASLADIAQRVPDEPVWNDIARIDMNAAWLEMLRRSLPEQIGAAFITAQDSRVRAASSGTDLIFLDLLEATWQLAQTDGAANRLKEEDLKKLRDRCEAAGLAYETGRANLLLGDWLLRQHQADRAQALYDQTLSAALQRGDVEIAHQAGLGWSRALQQTGQFEQAIQILEQTLDRIESIRRQIVVSEFRAGFLEDKLALYQELARLYLTRHEPILALQTIERAKSRTLADMLAERQQQRQPVTPQNGPQLDAARVSDLTHALQQARIELAQVAQGSAAERLILERRVTELARELERYTAAVQSGGPAPLTALYAQLPSDSLVLAYAVLQGQVWAFLIAREGLLGDPIHLGAAPDESALRQQLARVAAVGHLPLATAERWASQHIRSAQTPLGAWYEQFIEPLHVRLQGYARLIISPDGLLHHLPFACLWDGAHGQYLVEQHEVVLMPSLQTLILLNATDQPSYTFLEPLQESLIVGYSCAGQLSHTIAEVQQVAGLMQAALPTSRTNLLVEVEATYERVVQLVTQARLIYIATHGLFRPDAPQFSYLELANRQLTTLDILNLALKASIVVLSACETGLGRLTGNEMVGMVQAFLHAGARTVVATHWQVNDRATGQLMALFAQRLLTGDRAGAALAQAQRHLIQAQPSQPDVNPLWAHPYYWGGIWLVGAG